MPKRITSFEISLKTKVTQNRNKIQDCQRLAWKNHRSECQRLNAVYPNLPLSEVLFLSRVIDRVLFLEQNGDRYGWQRNRKWADLLGHEDDIRYDKVTATFLTFSDFSGKRDIFCKFFTDL